MQNIDSSSLHSLTFFKTCGYSVLQLAFTSKPNQTKPIAQECESVYFITFFFIWKFDLIRLQARLECASIRNKMHIVNNKIKIDREREIKKLTNIKRFSLHPRHKQHCKHVKFSWKMFFLPKSNISCLSLWCIDAIKNICVDKSSPLFPIGQCSF